MTGGLKDVRESVIGTIREGMQVTGDAVRRGYIETMSPYPTADVRIAIDSLTRDGIIRAYEPSGDVAASFKPAFSEVEYELVKTPGVSGLPEQKSGLHLLR